jgi:hypothetical protein
VVLRRARKARVVANLGRGGRLGRVKPTFPPEILWRAAGTDYSVSGEAHERSRLLGRPAGGEGEAPKKETEGGSKLSDWPKQPTDKKNAARMKALKRGSLKSATGQRWPSKEHEVLGGLGARQPRWKQRVN